MPQNIQIIVNRQKNLVLREMISVLTAPQDLKNAAALLIINDRLTHKLQEVSLSSTCIRLQMILMRYTLKGFLDEGQERTSQSLANLKK